ncbi:MAG: VCBS repeat-containing protein [Bacteroidetes bacterium]|nr:VCBS repeat-containing protein [Bacteroidota bacterium]MDA1122318.1 VCBS repeat-containing protein [Bacteroidota bacterium]
MAIFDYNNDGWLDIILENGECGIDVLENMQQNAASTINTQFGDGNFNTVGEATANGFFNHVSVTGNELGLPLTATNGDYMAAGDYNVDGYIDFIVRKPTGTRDLWENDTDGTFSANTSFPDDASTNSSGNPGGAIFCDFDNDGDLDIYWTDAGTNQVWLQTSASTFTASAKPTIPGTPNIDGCSCADIDGDGDIDMFLGNSAGNSYIYYNTTTSANSVANLSFTRTDLAVNADAEGVNLVDYDNDGDFDIYVNVNNAGNQLWQNDLCDGGCDFLKILTEDCIDGTTVTRPIVGAIIVLKDDMDNILTGAQTGSVASGHGAQNPGSTQFFLPNGPGADYVLDIIFPEKNGVIETYSYGFNESEIVANTLTLTALTGTDGSSCESFSVLPVELVSFSGKAGNESIVLDWVTATEVNNDRFEIERSVDGANWDVVGTVVGAGSSEDFLTYEFTDRRPVIGINYYRLRQVDFDGAHEYHKAIFVFFESAMMILLSIPIRLRIGSIFN